jgi:hypothetical protein
MEAGDYRVEIFDYAQLLPVAVWVVLPTILLFVLTVIHILYYGLKNYFELKSIKKDTKILSTIINKKLLNQKVTQNCSNTELKQFSQILAQLDIGVSNKNFSSTNDDLNQTVRDLFEVNSGGFVTSKEFKTNEYNLLNKIANDDDFALDIVKNISKYSQKVIKSAFLKVLETKSITTIKKLLDKITFDEELLIALFKKDSEQKAEFAMTNDLILKLIKKVDLTNDHLIQIAGSYKTSMTPDQLIKLYEDLSTQDEKYMLAYLYVLSQYEMIDSMRDILENSAQDDFIPFKALVDLKDAGKHTYSVDTLCFK